MKDWPFVERWVPFLYTFWGRGGWYLFWSLLVAACVEIKIYGAFVLNHRVVLHAIDATPARRRGDAGPSPLDRASAATSMCTRRTG